MSMERNPFAHLIPQQPAGADPELDADLAETEKWRQRGERAARHSSITPYINPYEGRQMPETGGQNPFAHLIPGGGKTAPIAPTGEANAPIAPKTNINLADLEKMPGMTPWLLKKIIELSPSFARPTGQAISENVQNLGRAFTEIGQGAKQAALGAGEYMGVVPYGTQAKYTEGTEAERKGFESTSAGKDPYGKMLRGLTTQAPFYAATALPVVGEGGILAKLLMGAAGGGAAKGAEYRQPGEDRAIEVAKGAGEGALMNLIPEIPGLIGKGVSKVKGTIGALREDIPSLQAAAEQSKSAYDAALAEQQQAKSLAKQSPLKKADADTMLSDLNANQQKLANIDKELAAQGEASANPTQYFVDTPKEAEVRLQKAQNTQQQAADTVANFKMQEKKLGELAQPEIAKADATLAEADKKIAEHLNSGAEHHVKGAQIVSKDLEANRKAISNDFDTLEANTAKQKITLAPESKQTADQINADLRKLVSENKADSKEASKLLEQLDNIGKSETVAANEYIAAYRSTNAYMREAYKKGYQPGLNPEVQRHWQGVGDELKAKLGQMDAVLEKSLKGKDYELFKNTSTRWKNEVVPLYRNPTYRKMKGGKGKLPANAMEALAGNEEGNVLIRNAIQKNPEALKHVVGQKYDTATGRQLVHTPNEQVAGYTSKMPELQKLIAERQNAQAGQQAIAQKYEQQRQAIKQAREQAELMQARAEKHVKMQKEARAKAEQMRKEHETKLENIKNLKQQRSSLEETNKLLEEHIAELKRTMKNANLTKEEHAKAAERLQRAEQKQKSVKDKLKWIIGTAVVAGAGAGVYKGGKAASTAASLPGEE